MFLNEATDEPDENFDDLKESVKQFAKTSDVAIYNPETIIESYNIWDDMPMDRDAFYFFENLMKANLSDAISKLRSKRWSKGTLSKKFKAKIQDKGLRLETVEFTHILTASDLNLPVEGVATHASKIKAAIKKGFERSTPPKNTRVSTKISSTGDVTYTINLFTKRKYISDPEELMITSNYIEELPYTVNLILEEISETLP